MSKIVQFEIYNDTVNVLDYSADPTGLTDSTSAIQAAIDAVATATALSASAPAYTWVTELTGGSVFFPRGWYRIDNTINNKNGVTLRGESVLSTGIICSTGFTDSYMITNTNGVASSFDSRIMDMRLTANNNANVAAVVHSEGWQEYCGLFRVEIGGFQTIGILIEQGYGGAARFTIEDCGFGGFSLNTSAIHIESTVPNAFQLDVRNVTVNASGEATNGILCENGRLNVTNLHVERAINGIHMVGGNCIINGMTGSATVTNLVTTNASFLGTIEAHGLDNNGATNTLDDNVTSSDIVGAGDGFHFPFSVQWASADATPSVGQRAPVYRTNNGGPTTITDFDNGASGFRFLLKVQDANTTIDVNGNANIVRVDGVDTDITASAGDWFDVFDERGVWQVIIL